MVAAHNRGRAFWARRAAMIVKTVGAAVTVTVTGTKGTILTMTAAATAVAAIVAAAIVAAAIVGAAIAAATVTVTVTVMGAAMIDCPKARQ